MKVGFFLAFDRDPMGYVLGAAMLESVRKAMPDVPVTQLTDERSPVLLGVDDVRRLPSEPLCLITARHYSECEGEWLLIDTDVLVQKDVRHVFTGTVWDVGITDRIGTLVEGETLRPWCGDFNIGVVFNRDGRAFWSAVVEGLLKEDTKLQGWMGNQIVASKLLAQGGWNVGFLPGYLYNYPPKCQDDDYSHASIVHFKGPKRKCWMWERASGLKWAT